MDKYKKFAERFAKKAGKIMLKNFELGMKKEWKADNTPVTQTDLAINSLLIKEVKKLFPNHSIKAEEQSNMDGDGEYVWVCDPVDGTIPFSHGIPIATFSLALVKNGESILGVVYDPFQKRLYSASKGKGAYLNGNKINVSDKSQLKGAVGEFEYSDASKYNLFAMVAKLMSEGVKLLKLNSVIYPSALVAAGELIFAIYPGKYAHDAAAIKIIIEEAGGKVTDLFGNEQRYDKEINGFMASNGVIHNKLVELSKKLIQEKNPI